MLKRKILSYIGWTLGVILSYEPIAGFAADETVSVSIHGVNYSADDITYVVVDPRNSKNVDGGEIVGPFGAGGIMCCYDLPITWRSGIQVKVNVKFQSRINPSLPSSKGQYTETVEIPPYVDGKPGELWVVRAPDGKLSVVSSDYSPSDPKWPGIIKNWPKPSIEYKRYRWQLYMNEAKSNLAVANASLEKWERPNSELLKERWDFDSKYNKDKISGFSGPNDERFLKYVRLRFESMKDRAYEKISDLEKNKP